MPETRPAHLSITDAGGAYYGLPILSENGRRGLKFTPRPSQPSDARHPWRVPVMPFDGGVGPDRLSGRPDTYINAIADASYPGMVLRPPLTTQVNLTNGNNPSKMVEFNSLVFILGGRYMYYYNPADNTVTEDKDFGVGKAAVDMAVFNNELVVAMGESEKIYTRNTAGTWTQAVDNTFAIALGVVDSLLWRAESTNKVSNCITAPRTLTSWVPASPNQYTVGSTTYPINTIIDFNGQIWVGKADGMYSSDPTWKFQNQTPQCRTWPHTNNSKGAFVAQGALWVPSASGLLRVRGGSSLAMGPERTGRPNYNFWVRGGVEFNGKIYIYVTDGDSGSGFSSIYKMIRDEYDPNRYTYHEYIQVSSTKGFSIAITTVATNPKLIFATGNNIMYVILGRGGGRDIDDPNYVFGNTLTIDTGLMRLTEDIGIPAIIQGMEVVLIQPHQDDDISCWVSADLETQVYNLMYSDASGGISAITGQTTYNLVRRFTTTPIEAQVASARFSSSFTSTSSKMIIREAWLFGLSRPKIVDEINIIIPNDGLTLNAFGAASGKSVDELYQKFYDWYDTSEILTIELPDYDEEATVKVLVSGVEMVDMRSLPGHQEVEQSQMVLSATFQRLFPLGRST